MRKQQVMFNWREVPFLRILIPLILGIGCYLYWPVSFTGANYLLLFLSFYFCIATFIKIQFKWRWLHASLVMIFFFLLGFQLSFYKGDWNKENHFRQFIQEENFFIGTIDNAPEFKDRSTQIILNLQKIGKDKRELTSCVGKVSLWLRNDTLNQQLTYGDLLIVRGKLDQVSSSLNPEVFDFKKYLHYKNIHYQGFIPSENWKKLAVNCGNPILSWAFKTRSDLIEILRKNLPNENEFAVASALILGYKGALSDDLKNAYSTTGAMHVLAVSGLHTGLIWGFIAFILNWIKWRHPAWKWIKTGITIACLWLFALVTGASPSVLRAATMFSFLLIGIALNRNTNIYNTLGASAFCLLIFDPYLIVEVGFQLSYLAVVGIVYFYRKIYGLWYIKNKVGNYLWQLSAVAIAAQLSTFPISMYYFHQFPVYFLLSGLIVVPFAFLILGTGISLFFIDKILPFLSSFVAKVLIAIVWLMNAMIFLIEKLPASFSENIWLEWESMILLYAMILCMVLAINFKKGKFILLALSLLCLICWMNAFGSIQNQQQRKIVFFHFPKKTYVEFIDGNKALAFGDHDMEERKLNFALENFHAKHDIVLEEKIPFGTIESQWNNWYLKNKFIQFFDKKIVVVDQLPSGKTERKIKVDYVLFRSYSTNTVAELNRFFDFDTLIIDGALSIKRVSALKKECQEQGIVFYDINEKGSLIINID